MALIASESCCAPTAGIVFQATVVSTQDPVSADKFTVIGLPPLGLTPNPVAVVSPTNKFSVAAATCALVMPTPVRSNSKIDFVSCPVVVAPTGKKPPKGGLFKFAFGNPW